LTHTDLDAVCCDAIFRRRYENIFTIFSSVQNYSAYLEALAQIRKAPDLTLCLSDLGGTTSNTQIIARLKQNGWRVEWRDHHIWDRQVVEAVESAIDYLCVNPELCACEIVFKDLLENDPIAKEIAELGRDKDFWINKDQRSEVLSTAISDQLSREKIAAKLSQGVFVDPEIERMYAVQITLKKQALSKALRASALFDSTAVTISNRYSSDVAAILRDVYHSSTELVLRTNGRFSIRTVAPVSNQIAALFDGGGHAHAAGGNLHLTAPEQLAFRFTSYRLTKVRKLIETASRFNKL
jgi:oligoribonuclease NrnB/cAMP/cGMP phosphodiesterase (DHH superfamily)